MLPRYILYQGLSISRGFSPTTNDRSPSKHSMPGSLQRGASTTALATVAAVSMSEYGASVPTHEEMSLLYCRICQNFKRHFVQRWLQFHGFGQSLPGLAGTLFLAVGSAPAQAPPAAEAPEVSVPRSEE